MRCQLREAHDTWTLQHPRWLLFHILNFHLHSSSYLLHQDLSPSVWKGLQNEFKELVLIRGDPKILNKAIILVWCDNHLLEYKQIYRESISVPSVPIVPTSSYLITWCQVVQIPIQVDCPMFQGPLLAIEKQCWREVSKSMFGLQRIRSHGLTFTLYSLLLKELHS